MTASMTSIVILYFSSYTYFLSRKYFFNLKYSYHKIFQFKIKDLPISIGDVISIGLYVFNVVCASRLAICIIILVS